MKKKHPQKIVKPIAILFISTSYPSDEKDWRGRFIADMVKAISADPGIELDCWLPPGNLPPEASYVTDPKASRFLKNLMAHGGIAHIFRTQNWKRYFFVFSLLKHMRNTYMRNTHVDVIHVNWMQNAIALWNTTHPCLITVLGTDFKLLGIPGMRLLLRQILKKRKCIIAPNAEWMRPQLEKFFGDIVTIRPIPFGVDRKWFHVVRNSFDGKIRKWIIVSRLTRTKMGSLFQWGPELFNKERQVHLLGPKQENIIIPKWVFYHGPTDPETLYDKWFPAAIGLITLSEHDEGRPQVILEAMAAGLPIIVSNLPAHRDIVQNGETGFIVNSKEDLAKAIEFIENPINNARMGKAAHKWVIENIGTWEKCASRYKDSYLDLMQNR